MTLGLRLSILFIIVVSIQLGLTAFKTTLSPRGIELPATPVTEFPMEFAGWKGVDLEKPEGIDAGVAARLSRVYTSEDGRFAAWVYIGIWTWYLDDVRHLPTDCYRGRGREILGVKQFELKPHDGASKRAALLTLQDGGQPIHVLYWYQLGSETLWDRKHLRPILRANRGKKNWPPQVKVMIDVRGLQQEQAKRVLADLGKHVMDWTLANLKAKG